MKKNISKELILSTCLQKQEALLENFSSRVVEMRTDTSSQGQSASQSEDRNAGDIEILGTMESELEFVQREMEYLKTFNADQVNEIVEPGAVVVTNHRTYFIAVSSEKVEIEDNIIFGISANAPIYSAMAGLKKGDTFTYNDIENKIENIY